MKELLANFSFAHGVSTLGTGGERGVDVGQLGRPPQAVLCPGRFDREKRAASLLKATMNNFS